MKKKWKRFWNRLNNVFRTHAEEAIENEHRPHLDSKARLMDCATCARNGHGPYHPECFDDRMVWVKHGVSRCWRPYGTIFVFDERLVPGEYDNVK